MSYHGAALQSIALERHDLSKAARIHVLKLNLQLHLHADGTWCEPCVQVFGKEAPSVTVDSKDFLPPAPKGSGDEELMGRCVVAEHPSTTVKQANHGRQHV